MLTQIRVELFKIFKKWRTYIGFITIAVLVPLIQIAMLIEGEGALDMMTRNIRQSFIFVGNLLNGYLISYIVLNSVTIHIPFLVTLVAGDLLAGEATAGTYRLLLTRPRSRMSVLTSKFIAGLIYTNLLVLFLAVISLGLGSSLFGFGELIVIKSSGIIIFAKNDIFWRFLWAYGFASLSMMVVASLAFLFSSFVENAIGPIVTTMAIIIAFLIISNLNIEFFQTIRPYLFTTYMDTWKQFFEDPFNKTEIAKSCAILVGHIAVFYGTALWIFSKKDILT